MSVILAVKPKYPNRLATDKVLYNEKNLLTMIDAKVSKKVLDMFDTSFVAMVYEDEYYPVTKDNYLEQFDLISNDEAPTVEADENFGIKKIESFCSASESDICKAIQNRVDIHNGIFRAELYMVTDYEALGDDNIDKNGYWFVFNFNLSDAEAEGYSDLVFPDGTEVVDGDNYIFMGKTMYEVVSYVFSISGTLTKDEVSESVMQAFGKHFRLTVIEIDNVPAITVNDVEYDSLYKAFSVAKLNGGEVIINKSITEPNLLALDNGKTVIVTLKNNVTVSLDKNFEVSCGSLNIKGIGTIKESSYNKSPVILLNLDESKSANVNIAKDITLMGWAGLFLNKASYNLNAVCYGSCIGKNDGSDNGCGIYVNGNVRSGSITFSGSTVGTEGFGIFQSGNVDTVVSGADVCGTDTGIEIRSGSLKAINSRIVSLSTEEPSMVPSGSGSTSTAVGIAIAQHTTKNPIKVVIDNCNISAPAAIMEGNPQGNPDATKDTSIYVGYGSYHGKILTLTPESDCTKFLYGGIYSEKPDLKYVAAGHKVQENAVNYTIIEGNPSLEETSKEEEAPEPEPPLEDDPHPPVEEENPAPEPPLEDDPLVEEENPESPEK